MLKYPIGVSALVVSTLTVSAGTLLPGLRGAGPEPPPPAVEGPLENDCGLCWDGWGPASCLLAGMNHPCHNWEYQGDQEYGGGSCHEHFYSEILDLNFADDNCDGHEWCGDPNCNPREEDPNLIAALDHLSTTTTLKEARFVLEAFSGVPGVWLELNRDRAAVQVLSQGCRPAQGGHVVEHLPLNEDMIRVWEAAFSVG